MRQTFPKPMDQGAPERIPSDASGRVDVGGVVDYEAWDAGPRGQPTRRSANGEQVRLHVPDLDVRYDRGEPVQPSHGTEVTPVGIAGVGEQVAPHDGPAELGGETGHGTSGARFPRGLRVSRRAPALGDGNAARPRDTGPELVEREWTGLETGPESTKHVRSPDRVELIPLGKTSEGHLVVPTEQHVADVKKDAANRNAG